MVLWKERGVSFEGIGRCGAIVIDEELAKSKAGQVVEFLDRYASYRMFDHLLVNQIDLAFLDMLEASRAFLVTRLRVPHFQNSRNHFAFRIAHVYTSDKISLGNASPENRQANGW